MTRTRLYSASLCLAIAGAAGCSSAAAPPQSAAAIGAPAGRRATAVDASEASTGAKEEMERAPSAVATAAPMADAPSAGYARDDGASRPAPPPPPVAHGAPAPKKAVAPTDPDSFGPGTKIAGEMAPPPPPVMQGPSVKAGEWDDNANYREFQKWILSEQGQGFHRADVSERQFLVVRDADGKAVPRCAVTVSDEQGRKTTLTTTASGRAILFPRGEGLAGKDLNATASCQNSTATTKFSLTQSDGVIDLKLSGKRALPAVRAVDLAFILDTTGSMSEEISAVKSTIQKVASAFGGNDVRVRMGMVEYKDRTDAFVTKVYPMTTDASRFSKQVASIEASGGGDTPEAMNEGLHVGLNSLDWRGDAVAKMAFLIADAPPHLDYPNDADYANDMRDAAHRGIQVFTVAASGMDDLGQVVFRQIAQYTGATNLFVMRGGAGPQSTGAGDPRSSCGGTQTAFVSGNLDGLIVQKIRRELKNLDRDPLKIAGLRTDENAKPCGERLMIAE
jgi:Mg-chelatase subunit ChlD